MISSTKSENAQPRSDWESVNCENDEFPMSSITLALPNDKCPTTKHRTVLDSNSNLNLNNNNNYKTKMDLSKSDKEKKCSEKFNDSVEDDKNINNDEKNNVKDYDDGTFVSSIKWPDLIVQTFIHAGAVYGLFLCFWSARFYTVLFALCTVWLSGFGITAGAHRLWSHRAYKATLPLQLILLFFFTIAGQRHVYVWALDHRVHHKYSETDSDPHNAKKGFWFSHVGWLVLTPHPLVVEKRKMVDMSDLEADPLVMWHKKYYPILFFICAIFLPVYIPIYFWNESLWNSFWINFNLRFCTTLNIAFFVNSVAHMWGQKPYDKYISPVENLAVSIAALGEGWHNYHHTFPWDYKTGELGNKFNPSTHFIDFFAKLGWAYDLKSTSKSMIVRRAARSGDGSYIWGYGDKDISPEDLEELKNMQEELKIKGPGNASASKEKSM